MQTDSKETLLGSTESVCPVCLRRIRAARMAEEDKVYLVKTCPDHGKFKTLIWWGPPSYQAWSVAKLPSRPPVCATNEQRGCPFDCGLCPQHRQHSCCVLLEVTQRCNLLCPVCFAAAGGEEEDPGLAELENWYRTLLENGGPYNIQLSGGEPTLRDDLPEIITLGRSLGYEFFQLNTNGLRLARDPGYVNRLQQAGLSCVFLQFDGLDDAVYERLRGKALFAEKQAAIKNCAAAGIGVVLVPTLVPGVNTREIGKIIQFAIEAMPAVRGVHFQPISYFGRYPQQPGDHECMTIPEIIREIEGQTGGKIKVTDFRPPMAENAHCSFHGNFVLLDSGELMAWAEEEGGCCAKPRTAAEGAAKARAFVAKRWSAPQPAKDGAGAGEADYASEMNLESLDAFIRRVQQYSLSISGMAFQDAWNLDLDRLKECFIHVVSPDKRIIPFCAYNLTDVSGRPLHRSRGGENR